MGIRRRYLEPVIGPVLPRKMVFVGGPRQVGKTTLALSLLGAGADETHPAYFNWDDPRAAARLRRLELRPGEPLLVLGEIHKYARWRNLVKGIYDTEKSRRRIVVTGSARLDYYRKGGDSLAGRYRYFRLHPFSLGELGSSPTRSDVEALLRFGGFPEPFLRQDERELRAALPARHGQAGARLRRPPGPQAPLRRRVQERRARAEPGDPILRRTNLDPAVLPGPPWRPPLRDRAGHGPPVSHVLPGAGPAVTSAGQPRRRSAVASAMP